MSCHYVDNVPTLEMILKILNNDVSSWRTQDNI